MGIELVTMPVEARQGTIVHLSRRDIGLHLTIIRIYVAVSFHYSASSKSFTDANVGVDLEIDFYLAYTRRLDSYFCTSHRLNQISLPKNHVSQTKVLLT